MLVHPKINPWKMGDNWQGIQRLEKDKKPVFYAMFLFQKSVYDVVWSPKSSTVFACVNEGAVEVWDLSISTSVYQFISTYSHISILLYTSESTYLDIICTADNICQHQSVVNCIVLVLYNCYYIHV